MSLIRRKPSLAKGQLLKLKEVAEILNCDHETIRRGTVGNFKLIRLSDKQTAPLYVRRDDVEKFMEKIGL